MPPSIAPEDFAEVVALADAEGFSHDMEKHLAVYTQRSLDRLVVTFDNLSGIKMPPPRYPWGYDICAKAGWSHIGIMTKENDWYRHADLADFFDELRAGDFFELFGDVVFYGTSMGAYGALAYAAAAPRARVIAFAPQSSLDPALVPFERRYRRGRDKGDWTGRYADAAESVKKVAKAHVFWDPLFAPDNQQVNRLLGDNVVEYHAYRMGHKIPRRLLEMGVLSDIAMRVLENRLTPYKFHRILRRARRNHRVYRQNLLHAAIEKGHYRLVLPQIDKEIAMAESDHWIMVKNELLRCEKSGDVFNWNALALVPQAVL